MYPVTDNLTELTLRDALFREHLRQMVFQFNLEKLLNMLLDRTSTTKEVIALAHSIRKEMQEINANKTTAQIRGKNPSAAQVVPFSSCKANE